MAPKSLSPEPERKSDIEKHTEPGSSPSLPYGTGTSSGHRPVMDSYRPQREPHRASSSLGPGPFDNSNRLTLESYRSRSSRMGDYGPTKRKTRDSPSSASDHGNEPSRKKQLTGREANPLHDRPPETRRYSSSSPFSSSTTTAPRARPAQDVRYHNEAYSDAARGRRASAGPTFVDNYRPRTPPPPVERGGFLSESSRRRAGYNDGTASPQQPRRFSDHYYSSPTLTRPPPPAPRRSRHFSSSDQSSSPAAAGDRTTNPKHLHPSECTEGRFIWVKRPASGQQQQQQQGWRCHPGVVVDEDGSQHAYVATTTSWKDFRGLHNKFSGVAHDDKRLEFERSFCLVVANAATVSPSRLARNPDHILVVRTEGADVFEQETYIDGRAVRRVRKDELCKYIKKGTTDEAFVTRESMKEMKAHFRYLARVGNSVWDPNDVADLEAWARFDAEKERRKRRREAEKEEGEISDDQEKAGRR